MEDAADPTGSGDCFAGGFLGYLSSQPEWDEIGRLKRAALYGAVLASFNIEDFGTRRLEDLPVEAVRERYLELASALRIEEPSPVLV